MFVKLLQSKAFWPCCLMLHIREDEREKCQHAAIKLLPSTQMEPVPASGMLQCSTCSYQTMQMLVTSCERLQWKTWHPKACQEYVGCQCPAKIGRHHDLGWMPSLSNTSMIDAQGALPFPMEAIACCTPPHVGVIVLPIYACGRFCACVLAGRVVKGRRLLCPAAVHDIRLHLPNRTCLRLSLTERPKAGPALADCLCGLTASTGAAFGGRD